MAMPHVSDFSKSEQQILLDLVNYANGTAFTLNLVDITFSQGTAGNAQVSVTAKAGSGYAGSVITDYRRLDIADFADIYYPEGIVLAQSEGMLLSDYLPEINFAMGTALSPSIVIDVELGPWAGEPNETKSIQLAINSSSLVYYGQVPVLIDGNDIPLDTVINNTILNGLFSPYNNDYLDIGPELATLIYPFKTLPGDTPASLKERLATRLGADIEGFALGENADDVFTIPQNGSEDVTVKITSKRSQFFINGESEGSVKLRFPEFTMGALVPNHQAASGWLQDANFGWYNNTNQWDFWYPSQNFPSHFKTQLKKIQAVFSSRVNTPTNGAAQNTFVIWRGTGTPQGWWIGVDDNNDSAGMQIHHEGGFTLTKFDVIDRLCSKSFVEPTAISNIFFRSNKLNTLPVATRGFKNLKMEFFVSE